MRKSSIRFKVGTRASKLALIQAKTALNAWQQVFVRAEISILPFSSPGDRDQAADLRLSADDFFTRDLDRALLAGEIDCAVHSAKDISESLPSGIDWFWLPESADSRDVLVLRHGEKIANLSPRAVIGVSSERREKYCTHRFPMALIKSVRGNIDERLAKLDRGEYDVLVMAAAGLQRLGIADRITEWIPLADLKTPDGQGALALTFRAGDERFLRLRSLFMKSVAFVGAGAGAAGSCTINGITALQRCDVCLHDSLLDQGLIRYLPHSAEAIDAGKRCGKVKTEQTQITELITNFARRGCRVVRLKAGDPGIFSRIAEEIEALDALHLPYRIIPGLSSLTLATTGTGIFLTRRDVSRGFCVITPRISGSGLAPVTKSERARLPLVLFMAVNVLDKIIRELLADGMPANTAAAIVFNAGHDEERVFRGHLAHIALKVASLKTTMPGLLIVGEIARYTLNKEWGALQGQRVLLTCSEALQEKSAALVAELGGVPVQRPLIRFIPGSEALEQIRKIAGFDWVVISSPSSVRFFWELLSEAGIDVRRLPKIMVSGPQTAAELKRRLINADAVPDSDFGSRGIMKIAGKHIKNGSSILRLRSDRAGKHLGRSLRKLGALVTDCVLFKCESVKYDCLPAFDSVIFTSGSTVESFVSEWGALKLRGKTVIAIGQPTASTLKKSGIAVDITSPEATIESTLKALASECVRKARRKRMSNEGV